MPKITPVVLVLVVINVALFLLNSLTTFEMNDVLGLHHPDNQDYGVWQYLTSMFMHGSVMHILFNMFGLWMFGTALEGVWGSKKFLFFYFVTGLGASVIYTLVNSYQFDAAANALMAAGMQEYDIKELVETGRYRMYNGITEAAVTEAYQTFNTVMVGASGALYGVLVAFAIRYPNAKLALLFLPFPIAAKYFVPILLCIDLFSGVTGFSIFGGGIAHFAHLGGALIGLVLMLYWRNSRQ
ncbi:rhomboid family intramembrane serine protease [Leucothrix pacifica]|uniref:Rhomboid family intramembrane serine protease n=1 Tax=Leucothrix pacifica TaxID=1247513 RepID=A0A317CPC5_9GAMM|nr:rhomboid family intramembrane serine protease [Leucothrix pacifica]PWR00419.1 rhomboid family intramembrane serine protease [Leucothrix pacifica]